MAFKPEPYHGNAKQILFNGDMVRAILSGQKTQTRRPVKKIPEGWTFERMTFDEKHAYAGFDHKHRLTTGLACIKASYAPSDILYVRETWRLHRGTDECGCGGDICHCPPEGTPIFRADMDDGESTWKPSIHMPKWAARIWLKVTNVRCERLEQMTRWDALREGFNARCEFLSAWKDLYSKHGQNPFVWVYEFERIDRSDLPEN